MINIIDFDHGCGGLTAGMERYGEFIVIYNPYLNEKNEKCYNNTHLNPFWSQLRVSDDDYKDLDVKIACFTPFLGKSLNRRGMKNLDLSELEEEMRWIEVFHPDIVLFTLPTTVLPYLYTPPTKMCDGRYKTADNWPYFDKILESLYLNHYKNFVQLTLNYQDFNIPHDKNVSFYIGWSSDKEFKLFTPQIKNKLKVIDILKKVPISDFWHNPITKYEDICSKIKQGSNAKKTHDLPINSGYVRLFADKVSPNLHDSFYKVSSQHPSIHPIKDRPLTIREGALINGLDNTFVWDESLTNQEVASMIDNSIPPRIGYYLAHAIFNLL